MALYLKENIESSTQLGIWKKEEKLAYLSDKVIIKAHEQESFAKIKNEARQKEWLTTRLLFAELMGDKKDIHYDENGKPKIKKSPFRISISHSKDFVAILVSANFEPGIDVERISERVLKVRHKFLTQDELTWCELLEQNIICWSAKEAIFKTIGANVDFKDITIDAFTIKDNAFNAQINKLEREFKVHFRIFENNVLTFTLPFIVCNVNC